jgi:predicted porin
MDVYGRLDGHLAFTRDDIQVKNNSSRFGFMVQQSVLGSLTVVGGGEWKMNLGSGDTTYNITENPDTGLGTFQSTTTQAFTTRLAYVGMRFDKYGTLTLGKQWGVYYDVSGWTDVYTTFGTHGSSTFNAGTDGGQTGEGRADSALIYRVVLGSLRIGVQAQFLPQRPSVVDGLAGAVIYQLGPGWRVGAAYSHAFLDFGTTPLVGYDGKDAQAFTAGVSFERAGWKLASVNTWTHDHEIVKTPAAAVMYDTLGAELFVSRRFEDLVQVFAGLDFAIPRGLDARFVNPNYGTRDVLLGARLLLDNKAGSFVYLEGRTGETRDASGTRADDVVMLGLRFVYSLRRGFGLEPLKEPRLAP